MATGQDKPKVGPTGVPPAAIETIVITNQMKAVSVGNGEVEVTLPNGELIVILGTFDGRVVRGTRIIRGT